MIRAVLLAALLVQAQAPPVKGSFSTKKASMNAVDAVAVWDPAKGVLRVALMPFKLKDKHLQNIRKGSTMFAAFDEKSPDPKKWTDWCPAAEVKLTLDPKALEKGAGCVQSYHLWVYGLEEKNFTHNVNESGDDARKQVSKLAVKLDAKGAGTFELTFAGKTSFDDSLAWDLTVKGVVLTPLADK